MSRFNLSAFAVRNRAITLFLILATLVAGTIAFGKLGRAESALDPAPTVMIETYVMLRPESEWREGVTWESIWETINQVATLPGITPASPNGHSELFASSTQS